MKLGVVPNQTFSTYYEETTIIEETTTTELTTTTTTTTEDQPAVKKPTKKELQWERSVGKQLIWNAVLDGRIPPKTDNSDPTSKPSYIFDHFVADNIDAFRVPGLDFLDYKKFVPRLYSIRKQVQERKDKSKKDESILKSTRKIYPAPKKDHRGRPIWKGSEAEKLFLEAYDRGAFNKSTPLSIFMTQAVWYKNWDIDFFRKKIHQEHYKRKKAFGSGKRDVTSWQHMSTGGSGGIQH